MAVFQFNFNENNRKCFGITLTMFCSIQTLIGMLLCTFGIYFRLHLQWKVLLIEGYDSEFLYKMIITVGIMTIILHLIGGKICYDCGQIETRSRFDKIIFLWLLIIFVLGTTQFVTSMLCFRHTLHARNHFKIGFISTMKNYLKNPEMKIGMDRLQIDHDCCGADNFKDWMITDWVLPEFNPLLQNPNLIKEYKEFYEYAPAKVKLEENQLIVTPFSCCDNKYMGPCFHDFITQSIFTKTTSTFIKSQWWEGTSLFQKGCVSIIMNAYNNYLTYAGYFFLTASANQFIIIIMARYLQTSIDNIEMLGKEDGTAPGWLCDCS